MREELPEVEMLIMGTGSNAAVETRSPMGIVLYNAHEKFGLVAVAVLAGERATVHYIFKYLDITDLAVDCNHITSFQAG